MRHSNLYSLVLSNLFGKFPTKPKNLFFPLLVIAIPVQFLLFLKFQHMSDKVTIANLVNDLIWSYLIWWKFGHLCHFPTKFKFDEGFDVGLEYFMSSFQSIFSTQLLIFQFIRNVSSFQILLTVSVSPNLFAYSQIDIETAKNIMVLITSAKTKLVCLTTGYNHNSNAN